MKPTGIVHVCKQKRDDVVQFVVWCICVELKGINGLWCVINGDGGVGVASSN